MRPVLLIDFDGACLNSVDLKVMRDGAGIRHPAVVFSIRDRVAAFADEIDAQVVIISAWRCELSRTYIEDLIGPVLSARLHDDWRTGGEDALEHRGDEVLLWVEDHGFPPHVIFDDDRDFYTFQPLVRTNGFHGVTEYNIELARWMIKQDPIKFVGGIGYINQDLIQAGIKVIAHGCNSHGFQGAGFAKSLAGRYPVNARKFRELREEHGKPFPLASIVWHNHVVKSWSEQPCFYDPGRVIANVITQRDFGRDPDVVYVDYDAVRLGLTKVAIRTRDKLNLREIGIPMIGSGLANGDWNVLSDIIQSVGEAEQVRFTVAVPDKTVYEKLTTKDLTNAE